jgi:D-hydroxyproline dehydrogenase subunit beta
VSQPDVLIVGGGIVGVACAYYCTRAGLSVELIEQSFVGAGATSAGMGHLVVLDDSEAEFDLCRYSLDLWKELPEQLMRSAEWDPCGTIWVAEDEAQLSIAEAKQAYYLNRDVDARLIRSEELGQLEPNLRPGLAGGLFIPGDGVVYAPKAARALWSLAEAKGARMAFGRVSSVTSNSLVVDGTERRATSVVLANGLGAATLVVGLPIRPKKGHLLITDRHPGFVRHQTLELGYLTSAHGSESESVAFNVQPRINGQIMIGSSRQWDVDSAEVDAAVLRKMLARAAEFMPALKQLSAIRTWTGLRPATPDSLPLIGRVEDGLLAAAGHEGLGITTSLGTGKIIADLLSGINPALDLTPFAISRFEGAKT